MANMQVTNRIDEIERRARAINLTLHQVCRGAGQHYSTIVRWRQGQNLTLHTFERVCAALEHELDAREAAVREALAERAAACSRLEVRQAF